MELIQRFSIFKATLEDTKEEQKNVNSRIHAVITIQQFLRKKIAEKRKWKAHLFANTLRSLLRVCALNMQINKYNRAAGVIAHFLETQTGTSAISIIVGNFRQSVMTIQRCIAKFYQTKKNRQETFMIQFNNFIKMKSKPLPENKQKRFKFDHTIKSQVVHEVYQRRYNDFKAKIYAWYDDMILLKQQEMLHGMYCCVTTVLYTYVMCHTTSKKKVMFCFF